MSQIVSFPDTLKIRNLKFSLQSTTSQPGTTIGARRPGVINVPPSWSVTMGLHILEESQKMDFDNFLSSVGGTSGIVCLRLHNYFHNAAAVAAGYERTNERRVFADGTQFSDGTKFLSSTVEAYPIQVTMVGATSMNVRIEGNAVLRAGMRFSPFGLHEITKVIDRAGFQEIHFLPPLRREAGSSTPLNIEHPQAFLRFDTDSEGVSPYTDGNIYSQPNLNLHEASAQDVADSWGIKL